MSRCSCMRAMLPQLRAMGLSGPVRRPCEMPLVEVLAELEWNGILVDPAELDRQRQRLQERIDELRQRDRRRGHGRAGPHVQPRLAQAARGGALQQADDDEPSRGWGSSRSRRPRRATRPTRRCSRSSREDPTVDDADPGADRRVPPAHEARRAPTWWRSRRRSTRRRGASTPSFNQTVAATGRLASSDPNLQNIPIRTDVGREIRRAFIAAPGHVLDRGGLLADRAAAARAPVAGPGADRGLPGRGRTSTRRSRRRSTACRSRR